jgi:hypothetical protein
MTKTLNQIIFFFSNIGNQNIFLEKKHTAPFKLNGRSLRARHLWKSRLNVKSDISCCITKEILYLLKKNLQNYILEFFSKLLQSLFRVQFIVFTLSLLFTFKLTFGCTIT